MGFDKNKRPVFAPYERNNVFTSTAASTALNKFGTVFVVSTSTAAPVVYTLVPPKPGQELRIAVKTIGSSSAGGGIFRFNVGTGVTIGGTTCDAMQLSTDGAGVSLVAESSSRWHVVGNNGATFSTST